MCGGVGFFSVKNIFALYIIQLIEDHIFKWSVALGVSLS